MSIRVIAPYMSCVVSASLGGDTPDDLANAMAQGYGEIYVITSKGIIKHHKLRDGHEGKSRYVRIKVDKIPNVTLPDEVKEEINFLPQGKIPKELFDNVVAFFRAVMEKKNSDLEAMIWILWNAEKGYHLHVPDQVVSKASARYDWSSVPNGSSIIVDIHSHNTMNAFFSGTDNNDDRGNISYSGVVGKLRDNQPMTVWRFNYFDRKGEMKFEDLFQEPAPAAVEVPSEWLDQVKEAAPLTRVGKGSYETGYNPVGDNRHPGRRYMRNEYFTPYNPYEQAELYPGLKETEPPAKVAGYKTVGKRESADKEGHLQSPSNVSWQEAWSFIEGSKEALDPLIDDLGPYEAEFFKAADKAIDEAERRVTGDTPNSLEGLDVVYAEAGYERYDELIINEGVEVAEAYCEINRLMPELEGKDELMAELVVDMTNLMGEEFRPYILKAVYDSLSERDKEQLAHNGL